MKKANGFWVDGNSNKWDCDFFTETQAVQHSETMNNCSYCRNCSGCSDCSYCSDCIYCSVCRNCSNCRGCSYCRDCSVCRDCSDCRGCRYCRDCSDFSDCSYCRDCSEQPEHYSTKKIGSRKEVTHFYLIDERIMVSCGCFWDDLAVFEKQVDDIHKNNEYGEQYTKEIKKVKQLWRIK